VKAFYTDQFVLPLPDGHSFPMAKYRALRERLVDEAVIAPHDLREPLPASFAQLSLVHHPDYVNAVFDGTLDRDHQRRIGFPWSRAMVERSVRSVGATIAATGVALDEGAAVNLAGGTHHAFPDRGEGYCVFNDVAVAARVIQAEHGAQHGPRRIAIIDCDVHQGNGTARIFAGDPSVFTFSIHGAKNFPMRKETSDLDIALEDGTGDADYLDALDRALDEVFARHDPEWVIYLAGADAYQGDRLGRLSLSIEGLRERDRRVLARCDGLPIVACMGGGYCPDIAKIVTIHANTVRELKAHVQDRRTTVLNHRDEPS
jgi:acetoin utilization deacetylase AcuC-like enzyme